MLLRDFEAALQAPTDLRLVYQPRIDLASGRCVGAEALMRWTHPMLGSVSPAEFIPLVERLSMATPMTAWVVDTAVSQMARWRQVGIELTISVSISCTNLREPDFAAGVSAVLARHGAPQSSSNWK